MENFEFKFISFPHFPLRSTLSSCSRSSSKGSAAAFGQQEKQCEIYHGRSWYVPELPRLYVHAIRTARAVGSETSIATASAHHLNANSLVPASRLCTLDHILDHLISSLASAWTPSFLLRLDPPFSTRPKIPLFVPCFTSQPSPSKHSSIAG